MEQFNTLAALFPEHFRFGVATSAYQIEGALEADGRGKSIWETFAEKPGAIERGENASVACEHYYRRDEDIALLRDVGVDSYRFSIAWPRIQPTGQGAVNVKGLAFYDALVDQLLESDILPFPTLYHWDLPQALEDRGGWAARGTAERFAEYAAIVTDKLGDRVKEWALFNEPFIFASRGYLLGRYAPGRQSLRDFLSAVHVITRAHALGFRAIKAQRPDLKVGTVFAMAPCEAATDSPADQHAARFADAIFNHLFLGPLHTGAYPEEFMAGVPEPYMNIRPGDMESIRTPLDFVGVNCYYRLVLSAGTDRPDLPFILFGIRSDERASGGHADFSASGGSAGQIHSSFGRNVGERTEMGWEIWPRALHDVLTTLNAEYPGIPLHVCESGCAFADEPDSDGAVPDESRVAYHRAHLHSVADAIRAGADVRSYHAWSFYDNFEWASGYRPRFGLVHVNYATQQRTLKSSAHWYKQVCHAARARRRELDASDQGTAGGKALTSASASATQTR